MENIYEIAMLLVYRLATGSSMPDDDSFMLCAIVYAVANSTPPDSH
jgi:hypothetical protein